MTRLLLVPPDTRPPTLAHPAQLARMVGAEVRVPPPAALNDINQPGDTALLARWLLDEAAGADVLVACLETLTLGGMIPARRVDDPLEAVLERLRVLREAKRINPRLRILAFGVVVRVAHDDDPLEEKPYYGRHGGALRAFSTAFDRHARHGEAEHTALDAARAGVPSEVLADWLGTRERNRTLHLAALDLVQGGVIEHLCLTLDDTSEYGLAAFDRRRLEARVDALGLWRRVDVYPGADEVPATLVARALASRPRRAFVRYSGMNGANAGLIYEDRPAGELVKAHLRAAGVRQVETEAEADFVLAVNTPGVRQANVQPDFATVDTAGRHLPEFVDYVQGALEEGLTLSLADLAYPNGAERRLWAMLQDLPLARLAGYAAWNTAGNTLGSAIAMGALAPDVTDEAAQLEALFARLVDDALYQAFVRAEVRNKLLNPNPFDLGAQRAEAERLVDEHMRPRVEALWQRHFAGSGFDLRPSTPRLAWPRLFTGVFPLEVVPG